MRKIKTDIIFCVLSFMITAIILVIAFALNGIYPGSGKSILIYDMGAQYVSFYSYLYHIGDGYNSVFFQTLSALGGGYFGTWAYYTADPLTLLVLLFDPSDIQNALYFLTLIKISLCSVTLSVYLRHGRFKNLTSVSNLAVSISYSLMSYNLMYSMNLMWIDGVIMLPLVILGVELMMEGKRSVLFSVALALSVIFNYYTGYMIVIFVIVYYIYLCIYSGLSAKQFWTKGIRFLFSGMASVLMSSIVLVPVLIDLAGGRLKDASSVSIGLIRSPLTVLRQLLPFSYDGIASYDAPAFYCGILATASLLFFFFDKKNTGRKKAACVFALAVFFLSFCVDCFDLIWHGMQIPVSYPARFSFVFSFFLITIFAEVIERLYGYYHHRAGRLPVFYGFILIMIIDLCINACYIVRSLDRDTDTNGYLKTVRFDHYYDVYSTLNDELNDDSIRIVSDLDCSSVDGLLFGISSLDYFSSSYNVRLSELYKFLGLNTERHNFEDLGLNPLSASLLGVDYYVPFISEYSDLEYRPDLTEVFLQRELANGRKVYENPNSFGFISALKDESAAEFGYNAFENLNHYCSDLTGLDDVFKECNIDLISEERFNDDLLYKKVFSIKPLSGDHLYFYVSPEDYKSGDGSCYDYLFIKDSLIASYENTGYRYIVDLGVSDGSEIDFTFVSGSEDSHLWLYSLDDDSYKNAMEKYIYLNTTGPEYTRSGIVSDISLDRESDLLLMLPFDSGYKISIDGMETDYTSYRGALLKIHADKGDHRIVVSYFTPGFTAGSIITLVAVFIFISCNMFISHRQKRMRIMNE